MKTKIFINSQNMIEMQNVIGWALLLFHGVFFLFDPKSLSHHSSSSTISGPSCWVPTLSPGMCQCLRKARNSCILTINKDSFIHRFFPRHWEEEILHIGISTLMHIGDCHYEAPRRCFILRQPSTGATATKWMLNLWLIAHHFSFLMKKHPADQLFKMANNVYIIDYIYILGNGSFGCWAVGLVFVRRCLCTIWQGCFYPSFLYPTAQKDE